MTPRRIVITVCPRERGVVVLPITRGGRAVRMNAEAILRHLADLVAERGLGERVRLRDGCAGGCSGAGPSQRLKSNSPGGVSVGLKSMLLRRL